MLEMAHMGFWLIGHKTVTINKVIVQQMGRTFNEVNLRWARLVLGWVTVSRFNARCRTLISVCIITSHPGQPSLLSLQGR